MFPAEKLLIAKQNEIDIILLAIQCNKFAPEDSLYTWFLPSQAESEISEQRVQTFCFAPALPSLTWAQSPWPHP